MGPTFSILSHSECYNVECDCKKNFKGLKVKNSGVLLRKVSFQDYGPSKPYKATQKEITKEPKRKV